MLGYRAQVNRYVDEYFVNKTELQRAIRESLVEGPAALYVNQFVPRHFEPSAQYRYGYAPRSRVWQEAKRRGSVRLNIPPASSPKPLVWSGDLREFVLGNVASGDTIRRARGIARARRIEVRVKVPLNHPINARNKGEITRTSSDENRQLDAAANRALRDKIRNYPRRVRITEQLSAAA